MARLPQLAPPGPWACTRPRPRRCKYIPTTKNTTGTRAPPDHQGRNFPRFRFVGEQHRLHRNSISSSQGCSYAYRRRLLSCQLTYRAQARTTGSTTVGHSGRGSGRSGATSSNRGRPRWRQVPDQTELAPQHAAGGQAFFFTGQLASNHTGARAVFPFVLFHR